MKDIKGCSSVARPLDEAWWTRTGSKKRHKRKEPRQVLSLRAVITDSEIERRLIKKRGEWCKKMVAEQHTAAGCLRHRL